MKDCDIACERISEVIQNKERIMILGDYDVDGTCGVSMFYLFMKKFRSRAGILHSGQNYRRVRYLFSINRLCKEKITLS